MALLQEKFTIQDAMKQIIVTEYGCWEWQGNRFPKGYGRVPTRGWGSIGSNCRVHRFFYINLVGAIPKGMNVLHKCDNPPCCNPDHLFIGTHADNSNDKVNKCRQWRPIKEKHYNWKKTNDRFAEWHRNKDVNGDKNPMFGKRNPRLSRENRIRPIKDILLFWSAL